MPAPNCLVQGAPGTTAIRPAVDPAENPSRGLRNIAEHHSNREHLACKMRNGIPIVQGGIAGYYVFNKNRQRLLILTRTQNQSIVIDDYIDIVVLEIGEHEVKLGVIGPDDLAVRAADCPETATAPAKPR